MNYAEISAPVNVGKHLQKVNHFDIIRHYQQNLVQTHILDFTLNALIAI